MADTKSVIAFVRNTLGCNCPEEVFSFLECKSDIYLEGIAVSRKINVGNRLLVYVIEVNEPHSLSHTLPVLVSIGKKERDESGFNRFRLVLSASDINTTEKTAREIVNRLEKDDKVHLHIIPSEHILSLLS
jgi:hypothetical protein